MLDRPSKPLKPRHLEPGAPHCRIAVDVMVEYLQDLHHGADLRRASGPLQQVGVRDVAIARELRVLRPDVEIFGHRQRLHSQPWRRPRRAAAETPSTMELIRRYEARFHPH